MEAGLEIPSLHNIDVVDEVSLEDFIHCELVMDSDSM
jgi:hypothetical protein